MARIFTIAFYFEQCEYEVNIKVNDMQEPTFIAVELTDPRLHKLIPESKDGLMIDIAEGTTTRENSKRERLKSAIIDAFKEHESQSPPINLW